MCAQIEALGLHRRVRLVLEPDHIEIWPDSTEQLDGGNGAGLASEPAPDGELP